MKSKAKGGLLTAALVAGVLLASACGEGGDVDLAADATQVAGEPPQTHLTLVAKGSDFDKGILVAAAGAEITLTLENRDNASHNFALYRDTSARDNLYRGDLFSDGTRDEVFVAPEAGVYYFRCDAHPSMEGTFVAR